MEPLHLKVDTIADDLDTLLTEEKLRSFKTSVDVEEHNYATNLVGKLFLFHGARPSWVCDLPRQSWVTLIVERPTLAALVRDPGDAEEVDEALAVIQMLDHSGRRWGSIPDRVRKAMATYRRLRAS